MEEQTPRSSGTGRRSFLAGVAATAGLAVAPGLASANAALSPHAKLDVEGTKEAVVDENGTVVYLATTDGMAVVDVADPSNPTLLAEERGIMSDHESGPIPAVFDASVSGDRLVVGGPAQGRASLNGFVVYDVSDPASPEQVAFQETDYGLHNLYVEDDIVYLTANGVGGKPVIMYNISGDDPADVGGFTPTDYDRYPNTIHDVYATGDRLYACYWDLGTWVVDVSEPTSPEPLLRVGTDMSTDTGTSTIELPGNSHYAQPHPERDVLAVGKEAFEDDSTEADGAPGGIELWDLSDPSSPTRASIIAPPAETENSGIRTAHNFGWDGDRLYASWYTGGVTAYEVTDPAEPMLLGGWREDAAESFWTAKPTESGFVGASMGGQGTTAGLFTFPDPPADGAEPAPTMEAMAPAVFDTFDGSDGGDDGTPTPTPTPDDPTPTDAPATPTPTDAAGTATGTGDGTATDTDASAPGFGALASLAAGGVAGWRLVQQRREE